MYAYIYESVYNKEKILYEVYCKDYNSVIKSVDGLIHSYIDEINKMYGEKVYGHYYRQTFKEDENMVIVDYGSHTDFIHIKFKEVPEQFGSIHEMYDCYYEDKYGRGVLTW